MMREERIDVRLRRRFRKTTDSNHKHPIAPNLLKRSPRKTERTVRVVAEITVDEKRAGGRPKTKEVSVNLTLVQAAGVLRITAVVLNLRSRRLDAAQARWNFGCQGASVETERDRPNIFDERSLA